ncbi:MAG: FAD-dependent oxidoreductase, partial [Victivallaceae bacterium]
IDWGIEFDDESVVRRSNSCWDWECGQYRNQVLECEHIRDYGLMSALCNWSYLKNHASDKAQWRNYELTWISPIGGKRESYRIKGDLVVTQNDLEKQKKYDDATAEISWNIDLHFPDPKNEARFGEAFQSCAYHRGIGEPFGVPYRALYARDMDNLFIGGRIISFSHVAFSCVRVMRTLGMLGEVIGLAAAVCRKNSSLPRELYPQYFSELQEKMQAGVPLRQPHAYYPDTGESFHFMRPAGAVNNSNENVWIRLVDDENAANPIPPEINDCIKKLNINCVREKMKF